MLAELSIIPVGEGVHLTAAVARAVNIIKASGLNFQVTAMGTVIEGDPDVVWAVLRQCHDDIFSSCERVQTQIRIDEYDSAHSNLDRGVERVFDQIETLSASGD